MPKQLFFGLLMAIGVFCASGCSRGGDGNIDLRPSSAVKPETLDAGALLSLTCSGCHSDQSGGIVSLNSFSEEILVTSLMRYKQETSGTTVMHRLARGYSEEDISQVSAYLSSEGTAR